MFNHFTGSAVAVRLKEFGWPPKRLCAGERQSER
jgi:hypothetical protein